MKWKGILGRAGAFAVLVLLACALAVTAVAQAIDQDRESTLTLSFGESGEGFPEVEFSLYRVASLTEEGEYALTGDFAQYPVSLEDLDSSGLRSLAQTLDAYVARDTLTPLLSQKTGEDGMVSFEGLSPGLYLVLGEFYTQDNTVYTPSPMLFYLPGQGEDGGWEYEVTASCKFDREETTDTTVSRKVQKVWKDNGNQSKRPEMVFVQLLENGAVVDTVALSEENNWEYTWEGLDASSRWQVAETSVPDGYTVTVTQEGTLFVVTNTYPGKTPPKLPQTGLLWWPVPLLACAGLALVIAGAAARRRGRGSHEK